MKATACSLLLALPMLAAWELSLLHVNDIHARMEETNKHSSPCTTKDHDAGKCYGGLARIVTAVKRVKSEDQGSNGALWINAGDFFQGTLWYTKFKWRMVTQMNAMLNFDAMTLGNHEFDDGSEGLEPFLKNRTVPMVVSNMDTTNVPELDGLTQKSLVIERGGRKIGFVGYLTPETIWTANVPAGLVLEDEIEALTREVAKLKAEGINIIVAIGHSGYLTDQKLAAEVPDVDIIIGAHSHSFLFTVNDTSPNPSTNTIEGPYPTVVKTEAGNTVLIVQAMSFTKYLGHIKVRFTDDGQVESWQGMPILLDNSFEKDPEVVEALRPGKEELDKERLEIIGQSKVKLFTTRQEESTLGNLITDAMVWANREKRTENNERFMMAVHHSGGIRTNLTAGDITLGGLMTVLPFEHSFDRAEVKGKILREVFEHSASQWEEANGQFLQVSGIKVVYNVEAAVGSRVCSIKTVGEDESTWEDLDDEKSYPMVVPMYISNRGDGHTCLSDNKEKYEIGEMDTDIVRRYIEAHNPVNPQIEGRIEIDNTCTRTAEPLNCMGNSSRSSKLEISFSILSLLSLLLKKFLP